MIYKTKSKRMIKISSPTIGYPLLIGVNSNSKLHHVSEISIDIGKKREKI